MRLIDIGQNSKIEIYIQRNEYNYKVVRRVNYIDKLCIGVDTIASSNKLFRFLDDDVVNIVYREDDRYWRWEKVKAGIATREDGSQMHVFTMVSKGRAFNRRTQFRLDTGFEITVKYQVLNDKAELSRYSGMLPELAIESTLNNLEKRYREVECRGYLKDLSEGGASVESDAVLEKGDFLSFDIDSDFGKVYCRGVIVRRLDDSRGYFDRTYGCSFVETSKNYIQYFYSLQRKKLYEK